jgi:hypothetical protein
MLMVHILNIHEDFNSPDEFTALHFMAISAGSKAHTNLLMDQLIMFGMKQLQFTVHKR